MDAPHLRSARSLKALRERTNESHLEAKFGGVAGHRSFDPPQACLPAMLARLCRSAVISGPWVSNLNGLPLAADRRVSVSCCSCTCIPGKQAQGIWSICAGGDCWKCCAVGEIFVGVEIHHVHRTWAVGRCFAMERLAAPRNTDVFRMPKIRRLIKKGGKDNGYKKSSIDAGTWRFVQLICTRMSRIQREKWSSNCCLRFAF